jgi:phosphatidylinositol alpha-1,6-mannosyltransferase
VRSLLLAASFPPAVGGVETLLYQTARRLAEPPLVIAPVPAVATDVPVRAVATGLGARLAYRALWLAHPSLHYTQTFLRPALHAARNWRPAVIQAGHIYLAPLAWLLARRLRLPFVVYAYGQEVWRGGRGTGFAPLDARLRGASLLHADRVLVPGTFTAGLLADWGVPTPQIVAIPYGAEPQPEPAPPPPTHPTLLSVARLIPRKGIDSVIQAMQTLQPDVEYRIVGNGPDAGRLRDLAAALGVAERVRFLGRLSDQALTDEYRRCTMFVLPARRTADGELEGYGLVYFEAAAWGRPVVAGRSGGEVDAVIDGETGVLVDGESIAEISHAIAALLVDPQRMCALGVAGRRRVETTHNWTRAAAAVDATLVSLV